MSVYRETREAFSGALRFDDLAPDTRALLSASCRGDAPPVTLLRSTFPLQGRPWGYLALAALLIAVAVLAFLATIGILDDGVPPVGLLLVITPLVTLAVLLVALAARSWWLRGGLPFPAGDYLFARDLVMARRGRLTLIPTRSLTLDQETPHQVHVLGPDGSRHRVASFACRRDGMAHELLTERDALDRAEQAGDLAACLRFDPFCGERAGWGEQARMEPPQRHWIESLAGVSVLLVALMAGSVIATRSFLPQLVDAVKLRQIARAEAAGDQLALTSFLAPAHALPPSLRFAAEEALFRSVMRSGHWEELLTYLKRGGPHAVEVSDEFRRRYCLDRSFYGYSELARWGRGPAREEADAFMFTRAVAEETGAYLHEYLSFGSRRDEVRRRLLPRRELDQALRRDDLGALRNLKARWDDRSDFRDPQTRSDPPPEMQQELSQAIDAMIDQHRVHLRERTGLRTSLARVVHQQIGKKLALAPAPGLTPHLFTGTRLALEGVITTYLPRSMVALETYDEPRPYPSPSSSGPPTIVLDLDPLNPCRVLPCRRRLQLVFHDFGDTEPATQVVTFTEPAYESGRTFAMAATEALTTALLGEKKR